MDVPSRRTCVVESKPEPKICTPAKSQVVAGGVGVVQVSVACGTRALEMPPITPGPGVGLGTISSEIWVGLGLLLEAGPRFTISILPDWLGPLPDSKTKAWFVAGSTATPPQSVRYSWCRWRLGKQRHWGRGR